MEGVEGAPYTPMLMATMINHEDRETDNDRESARRSLTFIVVERADGDARFPVIDQNPVVPGDVPFVLLIVVEWIRPAAP